MNRRGVSTCYTWTGTGNGTGSIGHNGSLLPSLSQTSAHISTWYNAFYLVPVTGPGPIPMQCEYTSFEVSEK